MATAYTEQEVTEMICSMLTSKDEWQDFEIVAKKPDTPYWAKLTDGRIIVVAHKTTSHASGWAILDLKIREDGHPTFEWNGQSYTFGLRGAKIKNFPYD